MATIGAYYSSPYHDPDQLTDLDRFSFPLDTEYLVVRVVVSNAIMVQAQMLMSLGGF